MTKNQMMKMENLGHSPTLGTVLMVEETLKNADKLLTVAELKRKLPRTVIHQTLLMVLDYVQRS